MNPVALLGLMSAVIAVAAAWAVVARPDRWAGAASYPSAAREIIRALITGGRASPSALARLRYTTTACLACASAMTALACAGLLAGWGWVTAAYFWAVMWHIVVTGGYVLTQLLGPDLASEAGRHG